MNTPTLSGDIGRSGYPILKQACRDAQDVEVRPQARPPGEHVKGADGRDEAVNCHTGLSDMAYKLSSVVQLIGVHAAAAGSVCVRHRAPRSHRRVPSASATTPSPPSLTVAGHLFFG